MEEPVVITISRQYGSGGHRIGALAAEHLGIPFYDREIISLAVLKSGIDEYFFLEAENREVGSLLYDLAAGLNFQTSLNDKIFLAQEAVIRELAAEKSCVIVGRCAGEILRDRKNVLRVLIHADPEDRRKRALEEYGDAAASSRDYMLDMDEKRARYCRHYTKKRWDRAEHFDLCIDSSLTGMEGAAQIIQEAYINLKNSPLSSRF